MLANEGEALTNEAPIEQAVTDDIPATDVDVEEETALVDDGVIEDAALNSNGETALEAVRNEVHTSSALLDALAESENEESASVLARQIQSLWNDSGSDTANLLMRRATFAIRGGNYIVALDLLDSVIALEPRFAEAWNRRATVHFLRQDYGRSISDVEQVLRLEPRHFGALSGIGIILDELGEDMQAQVFLQEALKVHPYLNGPRNRLGEIERRLLGAPI
ncbi:MAG: tetratricopeptide repeat protein [Pseudomonadota bacterium]